MATGGVAQSHSAGFKAFSPSPAVIDLDIGLIDVRNRLRPTTPSKVADLRVSIRDGELHHPVRVRPIGGRFELVVGLHRLEAYKAEGRRTIPATVKTMTAAEARLAEIDENLMGPTLTALERMVFIAARLEVWAERNPDKVVTDSSLPIKLRGRAPKAFLKLRKGDGYVPELMGFATETAQETGLSRQSIYRATQALAGLPEELRAVLQGTWIASNDAALRQLATLGDADEQAEVVKILISGRTKSISDARAIASGNAPQREAKTASQAALDALRKGWKQATPSQRAEFLTFLAGQALPKGFRVEITQ